MKLRWITTMVCLLYVSVSAVFATIHHHEDHSPSGEQCAACAWHHEGQVDVPQIAVAFSKPESLAFCEQAPHSFFREVSLRIHPSRGPPHSLL
jgi:hypothetical protein